MQAPTLDAKLAARGTESTIVASPVLHQGQPDGGESCIMLESGPTRSLIVKLSQRLLLAVCEFCTVSEEHCKRGYRWVCETLLPNVVAPEAYQNGCSYVHELSGPTFDSLRKNLAWWAVTWRTSKTTELSK